MRGTEGNAEPEAPAVSAGGKVFSFPRPPVIALVLTATPLTVVGIAWDPSVLSGLPAAVVASFCAAPNFNLADGCLVVVGVVVSLALLLAFPVSASAMLLAFLVTWVLGGAEQNLRGRWVDLPQPR